MFYSFRSRFQDLGFPPSPRHRQAGRFHDRQGFTLVELLVTVSITALLSSFVIVYTSRGRAQTTLFVEQAKVGQVIIRAKSLAISTYDSATSLCGYGVHFDIPAGTYALFSYTASHCAQISSIDPTDAAAYAELQRFSLPKALIFEQSPDSLQDVFFLPPDPTTFVWSGGVLLASGSGAVRVKTADNVYLRVVQVSTAGQVSF